MEGGRTFHFLMFPLPFPKPKPLLLFCTYVIRPMSRQKLTLRLNAAYTNKPRNCNAEEEI